MEKQEPTREDLVTQLCSRLDAATRTALDLALAHKAVRMGNVGLSTAKLKEQAEKRAHEKEQGLVDLYAEEIRKVQARLKEEMTKLRADLETELEQMGNARRAEEASIEASHQRLVSRITDVQAAAVADIEQMSLADLKQAEQTLDTKVLFSTKAEDIK